VTTQDAATRPTTPDEVLRFRARFPIFESKVHLATNSKGALADSVMAAHDEYLASWRERGAPWGEWVVKHEELRAEFAETIGASLHEVAVCPSASVALGAVVSALDWTERPTLVFDDFSFPSIAYLYHAQVQRGAQIRRVPADEREEIEPGAFETVLDESCQLVSAAHVCYKNGHRLDISAVAQRAHDVGALFVVDDYQSNGSCTLDVRATGVDVLTTGTVKYLLGSPGVALLYVADEHLPRLHPTLTGWFGQRNPGDFQIERQDEAPDATRFQNGTPAIPAIYDSLAGIRLIKEVGIETIERWIAVLTDRLMSRLLDVGFVPATPADPHKRGPQVAIRTLDMDRVVSELERRGVIVTSRGGNIRVAFHYYNTLDDIEALIGALLEVESLLVRG
jgi:selenocysteine lyase/cysteine desulfurase